jgi:TetR/AcrR family transcriptional regulator
MRKQRNAEETKERVLEAARELFAERGFSGTSLAHISERSGISDGLILHHYQTKENLYRQVLEDLAGSYGLALSQFTTAPGSPAEMVRQTLRTTFNFWKNDNAYQRISLWAYLEGRPQLASQETALTVALVKQVETLQNRGLIDKRFTPIVFLTMIIGPIHFWLRYRNQFITALNLTESADALDDLFLEQLIQLVREMSSKPTSA